MYPFNWKAYVILSSTESGTLKVGVAKIYISSRVLPGIL